MDTHLDSYITAENNWKKNLNERWKNSRYYGFHDFLSDKSFKKKPKKQIPLVGKGKGGQTMINGYEKLI